MTVFRVLSLMAVMGSVSEVCAQTTPLPLPEAMRSSYRLSNYAVDFHPEPIATEQVRATISFDTAKKEIEIDWDFEPPGTDWESETEAVTVSFEPTAMCARAGVSPTVYVAGWEERTARVIIEEWTVTDMLVGSSLPQGGGEPVTSFSKTIRKSLVFSSSALQPIRAMACNPFGDHPLVFEEGPVPAIWQVDITTGALFFHLNNQQLPTLGQYKSLASGLIDGNAEKPGFVVIGKPWRDWQDGTVYTTDAYAPDDVLLLRDEDLDGVYDELAEITWDDFETRGYWEHEVPSFTAP